MQNQPIDPAACLFSAQWSRYYNPAEVNFRAADFRFYGYCDPSLGRTASSDYSAIVTLAVDRNTGLAYVWDADIQRRHPDKIIGDILEKERLLRRADALVVFDVVAEDQIRAALVVAPSPQLLAAAYGVDPAAVGEQDGAGLPRFARLLAEVR